MALSMQFGQVQQLLGKLQPNLRKQAEGEIAEYLITWHHKWEAEDSELEPEEDSSADDCDELDEDGDCSDKENMPPCEKRARRSHREPPAAPGDGYPIQLWQWGGTPGFPNFNQVARNALGTLWHWWSPSLGNVRLLSQQHNVAVLVHPQSPVKRFLVDHSTGSGKTLIMLRIFDNFFFDERPKIAIFPKDSVCDNFYRTMLEWPTRMRDYFASQCPWEAAVLADCEDWRQRKSDRWELSSKNKSLQKLKSTAKGRSLQKMIKEDFVNKIRAVLEMKRAFRSGKISSKFLSDFWDAAKDEDVFPPAAPLRAYRFTSAGGRAAEIVDGEPRSCIFKILFDAATGNPYSNKIVLMDEGHHLTRPRPMYQQQLYKLRVCVYSAQNSILVLFTGTISGNSHGDTRALLDTVKGGESQHLNDEGFLSSHHVRGPEFPRVFPPGVNDGALPELELVKKIELRGPILVRYLFQQNRHFRDSSGVLTVDAKLANYTNMHMYYSSLHHGRSDIMNYPERFCPKFAKVIELVAAAIYERRKSLVMVSKRTGYKALHELLCKQGFSVAEYDQKDDFNSPSNAQCRNFAVLMLDTDTAGSEGVDLKSVQLHIFVEVPQDFTSYKQRAGRSVRAHGHSDLPVDQRKVEYVMLVACLPDYARTELGPFVLWSLSGYFSKTIPKSYVQASEPSCSEFEDAAKEVLWHCQRRGITTLGMLKNSKVEAKQFDFATPKLTTRLNQGLEALRRQGCESNPRRPPQPLLPSRAGMTADERLFCRLRTQAKSLAPEIQQIREIAVDAGLYAA